MVGGSWSLWWLQCIATVVH